MLSFKEHQKIWGYAVRSMFKKGVRGRNLCGCCGTTDDKGNVFVSDNQACHAGLEYVEGMRGKILYAHTFIMYDYREKLAEDHVNIAFLDFLIHRSVFSKAFVQEQDAGEVWADGVLSTHTDCGANLMVSAHIAARTASEFPARVRAWYELVQLGVDESLAFLLCHQINSEVIVGPVKRGVGHISRHANNSHTALNLNMFSATAVAKFCIEKVMPGEHEKPYYECRSYRGINNAWKVGDEEVIIGPVEMMEKVVVTKEREVVKSSVNPFPPARGDIHNLNMEDVFRCVAEAAIEYFEEIKKCV